MKLPAAASAAFACILGLTVFGRVPSYGGGTSVGRMTRMPARAAHDGARMVPQLSTGPWAPLRMLPQSSKRAPYHARFEPQQHGGA